MIDTCELRGTVEEGGIPQNQMPPSALMQAFHGCGFGCGSVAVLVTVRDMAWSQMVILAGK
jgi:hypothetical protein